MFQRVEVKESQIFTNASMAANATSEVTFVINYPRAVAMRNYSVQAIWSAGSTPIGVLKLQATNDGTNWVDIGGSEAAVNGNTGSFMWNISDHSYDQVRLFYLRASGSGTLNAFFKGIAYEI
jgi:hypothetical protein